MKKNKENLKLNIAFNLLLLLSVLSRLHLSDTNSGSIFSKAYLDPGTGTMIISAIIGVFATIVLGIKTFWYKITSFFKPKKKN